MASSGRARRQVEDHRPDLGPQEVVRARRPERGQPRVLGPATKSSTTAVSSKWPTCGRSVEARPRRTGSSAAARSRRSAAGSGSKPGTTGPERLGPAVLVDEPLGGPDDLERVRLAFVRGVAPGGDAVAAEDRADRLGPVAADRGDVETELEARPTPRDPRHAIAEAAAGQRLAVGGGRERDPGVGMEVVDVGGVDEARASRCRSTAPRRRDRGGSSRTRATISSSRSTPG